MSWFRRGLVATDMGVTSPVRFGSPRMPVVRPNRALQQSVVWACLRLRADLISLMPVDVYRPSNAAGINVAQTPPEVLVTPHMIADGQPMSIGEWLYSGQFALDRAGNNFGVITARDAFGLPARIELVDPDVVTATVRGSRILQYRINGERHEPRDIWHERQFTAPGMPIGMSPVAYSALTLAGGLSAQEFALEWFSNGAVPGAILRNEKVEVDPVKARIIEERYKATVYNGDPLVVGKDWTYEAISAKAAESEFIDQLKFTDVALTRFYGAPADLIDVHVDSATINYANITQRNLQLLVMNLGAAIKRREDALTRLARGDRFVKLNRDAILAMDPKSRADLFESRVRSRTRTPDELRKLEDLLPLTDADYTQFERLFGKRTPGQKINPEAPDGS